MTIQMEFPVCCDMRKKTIIKTQYYKKLWWSIMSSYNVMMISQYLVKYTDF